MLIPDSPEVHLRGAVMRGTARAGSLRGPPRPAGARSDKIRSLIGWSAGYRSIPTELGCWTVLSALGRCQGSRSGFATPGAYDIGAVRRVHRAPPHERLHGCRRVQTWNDDSRPYLSTKTADEILSSIARYCTKISDSRHTLEIPPRTASKACGLHQGSAIHIIASLRIRIRARSIRSLKTGFLHLVARLCHRTLPLLATHFLAERCK